jgi:hypothetical protein
MSETLSGRGLKNIRKRNKPVDDCADSTHTHDITDDYGLLGSTFIGYHVAGVGGQSYAEGYSEGYSSQTYSVSSGNVTSDDMIRLSGINTNDDTVTTINGDGYLRYDSTLGAFGVVDSGINDTTSFETMVDDRGTWIKIR